jgi:hypothetical protein
MRFIDGLFAAVAVLTPKAVAASRRQSSLVVVRFMVVSFVDGASF